MRLDDILIPTDFSACADRALSHAVTVADRFDGRLHILHVVNELDPDWYGITEAQERAVTLREKVKKRARERLQALAPEKDLYDVATTVSLQLDFDVADSIRDYVDGHNIDIVVMGTHGRQGLDRLMLGNVADKMVRHAPCPVMTVREEVPEPREGKEMAVQDVLSPIDFSEHSKRALRAAKVFAHAYGARLRLLFVAEKRVVPTFSDTGIPGVGIVEMDPEIVQNAEEALRQLDHNIDGPDVQCTYHVRKGTVSEEIMDFSEADEIDIIVMATRGLTGVNRFVLGSNTERIVRRASCPVLTIPPLDDSLQKDENAEE